MSTTISREAPLKKFMRKSQGSRETSKKDTELTFDSSTLPSLEDISESRDSHETQESSKSTSTSNSRKGPLWGLLHKSSDSYETKKNDKLENPQESEIINENSSEPKDNSFKKEGKPQETGVIEESKKARIIKDIMDHISQEDLTKIGITNLENIEEQCVKELIDYKSPDNSYTKFPFLVGASLKFENENFTVTNHKGEKFKVEKEEILHALGVTKDKGITSFCIELGKPYTQTRYTGEITKKSKERIIRYLKKFLWENLKKDEFKELGINFKKIPSGHIERLKSKYVDTSLTASFEAGERAIYSKKIISMSNPLCNKETKNQEPENLILNKEQLKTALLLTKNVGWTEFCVTLVNYALCNHMIKKIKNKLKENDFTDEYITNFDNDYKNTISNIVSLSKLKNVSGQYKYFSHIFEILRKSQEELSSSTKTNVLNGVFFEINHGLEIANNLKNGERLEISYDHIFDGGKSEVDYVIFDKNNKITSIIEAKTSVFALTDKWVKYKKIGDSYVVDGVNNQAIGYIKLQQKLGLPIEIHIENFNSNEYERFKLDLMVGLSLKVDPLSHNHYSFEREGNTIKIFYNS